MFTAKTPKHIYVHEKDLPTDFLDKPGSVAIDTEAMGLNHIRDRLCLVQLSWGDGIAHLVRILPGQNRAPVLESLLADPEKEKIFHFGRFDIGILYHCFKVLAAPIYCTRLASKVCRTYTERHGLKDLCRELLGVDLSKESQCSDWGNPILSDAQKHYAAKDVLYLHALQEKFSIMLDREDRRPLAQAAFKMLPSRVLLDSAGFCDSFFAY
jgi:ribonuclease D